MGGLACASGVEAWAIGVGDVDGDELGTCTTNCSPMHQANLNSMNPNYSSVSRRSYCVSVCFDCRL